MPEEKNFAAHEIAKEFPPLGQGVMTMEEYRQQYACDRYAQCRSIYPGCM